MNVTMHLNVHIYTTGATIGSSCFNLNGDGVVDRDKYKTIVEDILTLQKAQVHE